MMLRTIGFDRYIQLNSLNAIASKLCQQYDDINSIRNHMHDLLKSEYPNYEARRKTITVITRIWIRVPNNVKELQKDALWLLNNIQPKERIWLHWGMAMVAYPFFRDITLTIGRLLSLQCETATNQIHHRVQKNWGQRTTVIRAIDRVIQSLHEWKAIDLLKNRRKNAINAFTKLTTNNIDLQIWLIKAIFIAEGVDSMQMKGVMTSPSIFPFLLNISRSDLQRSNVLEYSKQDSNSEILMIKYQRAISTLY